MDETLGTCGACGKPMVQSTALGCPPICSDYLCASGLRPHNKDPFEDLADLLKHPLGAEAAESIIRKARESSGG